MPLEEKFSEVLHRTGPRLPGSMRQEFEAMLSPANLAIMAGTLVIWAGSHAFGVGEVVDVAVLISGAIFVGKAIIDAAEALGKFLVITSEAENEADLDEGASYLTIAITILGVVVFFAILAKIARRMGRSEASRMPEELAPPRTPRARRVAEEEEPPPTERPAPKPVRRDQSLTRPPARARVPSKVRVEPESKYGPLGEPTRQPGEGIVSKRPIKWGNPKSRPAYGHSQSKHGAKRAAQKLKDRASTKRKQQGHFYDDKFIVEAEQRAPLTQGENVVQMGRPVGRVYHPDGSITENVTSVIVIRNADGTLVTSYPIDQNKPR